MKQFFFITFTITALLTLGTLGVVSAADDPPAVKIIEIPSAKIEA